MYLVYTKDACNDRVYIIRAVPDEETFFLRGYWILDEGIDRIVPFHMPGTRDDDDSYPVSDAIWDVRVDEDDARARNNVVWKSMGSFGQAVDCMVQPTNGWSLKQVAYGSDFIVPDFSQVTDNIYLRQDS